MDLTQTERWRSDTPGCAYVNHLNNAGASLPPRVVLDAMREYLELEAQIGGYEAADRSADAIAGFYNTMGRLLGANADHIAFAGSATDAYARALSAIPWQPGDVILTTANDYVSNQIAFLSLQKRFGVRLLRVRDSDAGGVDLDDFQRLLFAARPKLVAVTQVPTNSGLVQAVSTIGQLCRAIDTWYLVDACQSVGQMPLDVSEIGCDFLTGTFRKYLRGPRGAGFLYVSEKVLTAGLEMPTPDMRGADWTGADTYTPAGSARRFEYWEMAPALLLGSKAAVEYTLNQGIGRIEQEIRQLAAYTRSTLSALPGIRILDEGTHLCGIVTAYADHWPGERIVSRLQQQGINCRVSSRQVAQLDFQRKGVEWALRISPHYYNTEAEINQLAEVLQREFPR